MADTFNKGETFGGFRIVAEISHGEFGETWLCENPITRRKAVLKGLKQELLSNTDHPLIREFDILTRTREEAQIVAALGDRHFSFVPVLYDAVTIADGRVFFLTEYIEGTMLRDWILRDQVTPEDIAGVAVDLLHAICRLHAVGIVHRDLAGDNIIIAEDNSIKLVDFGLAKIKSEILVRKYSARTVTPFTKIKYTPPKVLQAHVRGERIESDESWDLYALGVLLFEMFSRTVVGSPDTDITNAAIKSLPCPNTITSLLENGRSNNAPGAEQVAGSLNTELRAAKIEVRTKHADIEESLVESLQQEIAQLQADVRTKRGKTELSDVVDYLNRMGFVYTVDPRKKWASLDFSLDAVSNATLMIDASDEKLLTMGIPEIRTIRTNRRKLLETITRINSNAQLARLTFDPDDGEVAINLTIAHANVAIPYEEFRAQMSFLVSQAEQWAAELDESFASPQRKRLQARKEIENSKQSDDGDAVTTDAANKPSGGDGK